MWGVRRCVGSRRVGGARTPKRPGSARNVAQIREIFLRWSKSWQVGAFRHVRKGILMKREAVNWPFSWALINASAFCPKNPPTRRDFDHLRKISRTLGLSRRCGRGSVTVRERGRGGSRTGRRHAAHGGQRADGGAGMVACARTGARARRLAYDGARERGIARTTMWGRSGETKERGGAAGRPSASRPNAGHMRYNAGLEHVRVVAGPFALPAALP